MPRYAIVSQSTDRQSPNTQIQFKNTKNLTEKTFQKWIEGSGRYVFDEPQVAKNFHRIKVKVFELPEGWRKPSFAYVERVIAKERGSVYRSRSADVVARVIADTSTEISYI